MHLGLEDGLDRGDAVAMGAVRQGTMCHRCAAPEEQRDIGGVDPHGVNAESIGQAHVPVNECNGSHAERLGMLVVGGPADIAVMTMPHGTPQPEEELLSGRGMVLATFVSGREVYRRPRE
jgi:hypothetical protein